MSRTHPSTRPPNSQARVGVGTTCARQKKKNIEENRARAQKRVRPWDILFFYPVLSFFFSLSLFLFFFYRFFLISSTAARQKFLSGSARVLHSSSTSASRAAAVESTIYTHTSYATHKHNVMCTRWFFFFFFYSAATLRKRPFFRSSISCRVFTVQLERLVCTELCPYGIRNFYKSAIL